MQLLKNIGRGWLLKSAFVVAGLVLFATQLSGKFYQFASMPFLRASIRYAAQQHRRAGLSLHSLSGEKKTAHFSLDKRYDLTTVFDLPAPTSHTGPYTVGISRPIPLHAGHTESGIPVRTLLRGPPTQKV